MLLKKGVFTLEVQKNIVIYIDYENIHKTLLFENKNFLGIGFFEKLRKWCNDNNLRVIDIIAYCNFDLNDLYESHHQTKLQEYGVETVHTSNRGKNFADLKITADLLEAMHTNNNINGFIVVSNDKDMTPVIKAIKKYKDFVYLITAGSNFDESILNFPDKTFHISEIEKIEIESNLEIERIYDEVYNSLNDYLKIKFQEYLNNKSQEKEGNQNSNSKSYILDYGLEYYIKSSFPYFNIMKYEFANIIKQLVCKQKLFLYKYEYYNNKTKKNESSVAVVTEELKQKYLDNEVMKDTDVINDYVFDELIEKIYKEYLPKK